MTWLIELILAILAALTGQTLPVAAAAEPAPYVAPVAEEMSAPVVPCQEDDPCWDCEIHGNLTCGPELIEPVTMEAEDIGDVWEPVNWLCQDLTITLEWYEQPSGAVWSLGSGPCTSEVAEALR